MCFLVVLIHSIRPSSPSQRVFFGITSFPSFHHQSVLSSQLCCFTSDVPTIQGNNLLLCKLSFPQPLFLRCSVSLPLASSAIFSVDREKVLKSAGKSFMPHTFFYTLPIQNIAQVASATVIFLDFFLCCKAYFTSFSVMH